MYLNARGTLDDVAVCNYAVRGDEKSAAAGKRIIFSVKCFDSDRRWLNSLYKLGQEILRDGLARETREKHKKKEYFF